VSALLPKGCRSLVDAPYHLHDAIVHALHFLKWEELPPDERPDKRIWLDGEKLTAHFEAVDRMRKAKYGIDGAKEVEGPVDTNEAAKDLIL
jgi:hypothetical protein